MADLFEQADVVFAATNPDIAFDAAGPMPTTVGDVDLIATYGFDKAIGNNGALTIPANLSGLPGRVRPGRHRRRRTGRHADHRSPPRGAAPAGPGPLAERERPWPLVAPSVTA